MFKFSRRSMKNLENVDADLKKIFMEVIKYSPYDFAITEGVRTIERQRELVRQKKSWTMNSYHLSGKAVDICVLIDGKANWEYEYYAVIAKIVKFFAEEMCREEGKNFSITWGGNWKQVDACHFQIEKNEELKLVMVDDNKFKVENNYSYKNVEIPKNFKTDLASIPKFLWSFISPLEKHSRAAVVHDFLYSDQNEIYNRKEADKIFLEAMKEDGVNVIKRNIMYFAVRLFGKIFFKKDSRGVK